VQFAIKDRIMSRQKRTLTSYKPVSRSTIVDFLDKELRTDQIRDYSCNGLQVEGDEIISRIGFTVDACLEAYECAAREKCQMLVVHHGIIWDGIRSISGSVRDHIRFLLKSGINLYASHLPLDLHPQLGNNAGLAKLLGVKNIRPFGNYKGVDIGFEGVFTPAVSLDTIVHTLCDSLSTECTVLPFGNNTIRSVAIVSGGGGDELAEAISRKVDCYITGEPVHHNYHAALEAKINVIYAGHYHTEKCGVQALAALCEQQFSVETLFIDIPTTI
jgi:dinuclear metal center YbgI/SA1388 family protein